MFSLGLLEWCEVGAGVAFLAGLALIGSGLALFSCNIAFGASFEYLTLVFFGFVLALAGKSVMNLLIKKSVPVNVPGVAAVSLKSGLCQYCGKDPESDTKCVKCGGVPFGGVKQIDGS